MNTEKKLNCSGNLFFWDDRLGSVDASILGIPAGSGFPQLIAVRSHRTGVTVNFKLDRVESLTVTELAIGIYNSAEGFGLHIYSV